MSLTAEPTINTNDTAGGAYREALHAARRVKLAAYRVEAAAGVPGAELMVRAHEALLRLTVDDEEEQPDEEEEA
jgi:hypothetical protein